MARSFTITINGIPRTYTNTFGGGGVGGGDLSAYQLKPAEGPFVDGDKTKLDGIQSNAKDDQTGAEIKAAYEAEANTNAYTDAEKSKLAGLESSRFLGTYVSAAALLTAHPAPVAGSYAHVDAGVGEPVQHYIWDDDDDEWVIQVGTGGEETAASIKTKYESNADTNAFTDAEKAKVVNVPADTNAALSGKQDSNANLTAEAGLTGAANKLAYYTGLGTKALTDFTAYARTFLGLGSKAAVQAELAIPANTITELASKETPAGAQTKADAAQTAAEAAAASALSTHESDTTSVHGISDTAQLQIKPAEGAFVDGDKTKLDGIQSNAKDDQTGAEIKSLYEAEANTNAYTDAEKSKLAGLESSRFLGTYVSAAALLIAHPAPVAGSYAHVDAGVGEPVQHYIWDDDDDEWVIQVGTGGEETAASIKTKYESNADTNAFTDAEKAKIVNVPADTNAALSGKQDSNANLTAEAGLTGAADRLSYYTGAATKALAVFTSYGRTLLALASKSALKTELDLDGSNTGDQDLSALALKSNVLELDNTDAFTPDADYEPATKKYVDDNAAGMPILQLTDHPSDKYSYPKLDISGTLTSDGATPVATGEELVFSPADSLWEDISPNWQLTHDPETNAGTNVLFTLTHTSGATWNGSGAWGDWENIVWTPDGTETGSPVLTPQITAGLAGQIAICEVGNSILVYRNTVADDADDERWILSVGESYFEPNYIASPTGTIYLDCRNHITHELDQLTGNITLHLQHLRDGQSGTIRGWQGASRTVAISTDFVYSVIYRNGFLPDLFASGVLEQTGTLASIAALSSGDKFRITYQVIGTQLVLDIS